MFSNLYCLKVLYALHKYILSLLTFDHALSINQASLSSTAHHSNHFQPILINEVLSTIRADLYVLKLVLFKSRLCVA